MLLSTKILHKPQTLTLFGPIFLGIAQKKIKEKPQLPFHSKMEVDIEMEVGAFLKI